MTYNDLPEQLYTAEQIRERDLLAIKKLSISGFELMFNAASAVFDCLLNNFPKLLKDQRLQVFCGPGNNGGDGYILAALAAKRKILVKVIAMHPPNFLSGDALLAYQYCKNIGVNIIGYSNYIKIDADVIVDALLGTGLTRNVEGNYAYIINQINRSHKPVLAIDIPSGLSADTGAVLGFTVKAKVTVTLIGVKQGLLTAEGPEYCGKLFFRDLGTADIPQKLISNTQLVLGSYLLNQLKPRKRNVHKGKNGHLLVIGGDIGMAGAAILSVEGALYTGCGLLTLATQPEHTAAAIMRHPEIMVNGIDSKTNLVALLEKKDAIVLGPGLGCSDWAKMLLQAVWSIPLPLLVDADGLHVMNELKLSRRSYPLIITPHPGEAAMLLDVSSKAIEQDRFTAIHTLQQKYNATVILKGAGTLLAYKKDHTWLCHAGNPGMATGGMGDLLSGIIGALLLTYMESHLAAALGVWLHASAADTVVKYQGERGLLATDILPYLRLLVNKLDTNNVVK